MARVKDKIVLYALVAMMAYAFFFRVSLGQEDGGGGASGAIVSLLLALSIALLMVMKQLLIGRIILSKPALLAILFYVVSVFFCGMSYAYGVSSKPYVTQMVLEVSAMALLFCAVYFPVRLGIVPFRSVLKFLGVIGFGAGCYALSYNLSASSSLRRLEGMAGLNYFASTMAVSGLACLISSSKRMEENFTKRIIFSVMFFFMVVFVFLIGSRQALAVMVLGACVLIVNIYGFRKMMLFVPAAILASSFLFFYFVEGVDISMLLSRFDVHAVEAALDIRFGIFRQSLALAGMDVMLVGNPDLYEVWNDSSIHPHNIFISAIRNFGILSAVILFVGIVFFIFRAFRLIALGSSESLYALLIFLVAFVYVLVSGNITRALHFYFLWGLAVGCIDVEYERFRRRSHESSLLD